MPYDIQISEKDLPMMSAVATEAMQLLNSNNVTNQHLNDLIRQDPSLAGRVLHIANSPFYGGRFQARRISDAIVRLGLRQLRNILVVAATGELFDAKDPNVRGFWDHALTVATLSDKIASALDLPDTEEIFIAGLMHDIGKFVIYQQHPEPYTSVIQQAAATGRRLVEIEDEQFQFFNHVTVGGIAIRKWKLADDVAETSRFHHVIETMVPDTLQNKNLVCCVAIANALVNICAGTLTLTPEELAEWPSAEILRLDAAKITKFATLGGEICQLAQGEAAVGA